jgi:hypothetical protein
MKAKPTASTRASELFPVADLSPVSEETTKLLLRKKNAAVFTRNDEATLLPKNAARPGNFFFQLNDLTVF